jgi:hypothetical protein
MELADADGPLDPVGLISLYGLPSLYSYLSASIGSRWEARMALRTNASTTNWNLTSWCLAPISAADWLLRDSTTMPIASRPRP